LRALAVSTIRKTTAAKDSPLELVEENEKGEENSEVDGIASPNIHSGTKLANHSHHVTALVIIQYAQ